MEHLHCDVCVVGAGLAGISAALTAATHGAQTVLLAKGPWPSGASFFPGTWGVGVVGAKDGPEEHADFVEAILANGQAMADPALVRALVDGTPETLSWLESLGVVLERPEPGREDERAYIPCFDHRTRNWAGLRTKEVAPVLWERLQEAGVRLLEGCELLSLVQDGRGDNHEPSPVTGIVALHNMVMGDWGPSRPDPEFQFLSVEAPAVVLTTGGMAAIHGRFLTDPGATGTGAVCALDAGATLVNLEFTQIMTGFQGPHSPIVFNEKLWPWARLVTGSGADAFEAAGVSPATAREALLAHGIHGPFTASRVSRHVEEAIAQAVTDDAGGCRLTLDLPEAHDEFVDVYLDWLSDQGLSLDGSGVAVELFAQASNGGIAIREDTSTGVPGLWAAGETTGAVHGADRIGGLTSASALTMGRKAGFGAAASALDHGRGTSATPGTLSSPLTAPLALPNQRHFEKVLEGLEKRVRTVNDQALLVGRSAEGLDEALAVYDDVQGELARLVGRATTAETVEDLGSLDRAALGPLGRLRSLETLLCASRAQALAAALRRESRGSHQRSDFPETDPAFDRRILVEGHSGHGTDPGILEARLDPAHSPVPGD